jgi:toxin ParE1/3/4
MEPEVPGYRLSPQAMRDLDGIWHYNFVTWSRVQADDYYRDLVNAMSEIAKNLKRGKQIDHIRRGYLSLSSGSHLIIYKRSRGQISIIRILHQRMSIDRHL